MFSRFQLTAQEQPFYHLRMDSNYSRVSRLLAGLMLVQWLAAIVMALLLSPYTWEGKEKIIHAHVPVAIILGGILTALPVFLAVRYPSAAVTRHTIVAAQMLWSALLIHLSGGRIETHFHIFCSLGFFAAYRDWKVLITATLVVASEHFVRGLLWPESIYGILNPAWWRFLEHAWWVIFASAILIYMSLQNRSDIANLARSDYQLKQAMDKLQASSQSIEDSAGFLTRASYDLSRSTQEQKSATEELSVTNEQLSATAKQNATLSLQVSEKIIHSKNELAKNKLQLEELTQAISSIKASSNEIQSINNLVDEIAYQTNLLSLNAMIEASRAGEGNGGFKVVALEVKRLAERAAEAAGNINSQLSRNASDMKKLAETISVSIDSFNRISGDIMPLSDDIITISRASNEQSDAIAQISLSLISIDKTTELNRELAEQSAAIADQLQQSAAVLAEDAKLLVGVEA